MYLICAPCHRYPQNSNFKIWVCWDPPTCLPVTSRHIHSSKCPLIVPRFSSPLFSHSLLLMSFYILILLNFLILSPPCLILPYHTLSRSSWPILYPRLPFHLPSSFLCFSSSASFLRPIHLIYLPYALTSLRVYSIDFSASPLTDALWSRYFLLSCPHLLSSSPFSREDRQTAIWSQDLTPLSCTYCFENI